MYSYNWIFLFSEVGQNLYVNYNEKDATAPVDAWWAEISYYDYDDDSCTPGKQCGHYKQVPGFLTSFFWLKFAEEQIAINEVDQLYGSFHAFTLRARLLYFFWKINWVGRVLCGTYSLASQNLHKSPKEYVAVSTYICP